MPELTIHWCNAISLSIVQSTFLVALSLITNFISSKSRNKFIMTLLILIFLMKTLLVLFCIIAFASASFSPVWNQCGNSSDVFTPTNVTLQKDPKNETQTLISACGTVKSHGPVTVVNRLKIELDYGFL